MSWSPHEDRPPIPLHLKNEIVKVCYRGKKRMVWIRHGSSIGFKLTKGNLIQVTTLHYERLNESPLLRQIERGEICL